MDNEIIRIGIIGAGNNTRTMHIPYLQKLPGVEITSVCNRSIESGKKVADEFGIENVCGRWDEVILDDDIDAIVIGTWPYKHCQFTCAALHHGKHVLCEARMAMNAAEAHEMNDTLKLYPELVGQIVPSPLTLAYDATIQDLVADGFFGELLAVDVRGTSRSFLDNESPLHWRQDFDLSGYNTLTMGIWYEALGRWIGPARSVMAMSRVYVRQRREPDNGRSTAVRVPEHVDAIAEMDCGAQARFQFSVVTGLGSPGYCAWLYGSEGTLCVDIDQDRLRGGRRGDEDLSEIDIKLEKKGEWRVEEEFINAIRGEEAIVLTSFADGVKYMEFTEAVAVSAESGKTVHLPL